MFLPKIYNVYFGLNQIPNKNVCENSTHCCQLYIARLWQLLIFTVTLKWNGSQTNLFSKDKTILFIVMATLGKWVSARLLDLFVAQSGIKTHPSLCPGSGRDYCWTTRRTRQSTRSPTHLYIFIHNYYLGMKREHLSRLSYKGKPVGPYWTVTYRVLKIRVVKITCRPSRLLDSIFKSY